MAMLTVPLNPARNIAQQPQRDAGSNAGMKRFSTRWAVASAEDRVMVMSRRWLCG
jgi:hypothetical protein